MKGQFTLQLRLYPRKEQAKILETFFEAQTRANMVYLLAHPDTPDLYASGVVYRREGTPEVWKDIPTALKDGWDDCEGLASWLAAQMRVRKGKRGATVKLIRQGKRRYWHAIVEDVLTGKRYDPSKKLGMRPRKRNKA